MKPSANSTEARCNIDIPPKWFTQNLRYYLADERAYEYATVEAYKPPYDKDIPEHFALQVHFGQFVRVAGTSSVGVYKHDERTVGVLIHTSENLVLGIMRNHANPSRGALDYLGNIHGLGEHVYAFTPGEFRLEMLEEVPFVEKLETNLYTFKRDTLRMLPFGYTTRNEYCLFEVEYPQKSHMSFWPRHLSMALDTTDNQRAIAVFMNHYSRGHMLALYQPATHNEHRTSIAAAWNAINFRGTDISDTVRRPGEFFKALEQKMARMRGATIYNNYFEVVSLEGKLP